MLVENHLREVVTYFTALSIDSNVVAIHNNECWHGREMEKPTLATNKIIAISASDGKVAHIRTKLRDTKVLVTGILHSSSLKTEACQPRACRTLLDVRLCEGCRIREAPVVERIVTR